MNLSRKWLNEFIDLSNVSDKAFNDAMTLSGSKVETVTREGSEIKNVVVGKIVEMVRRKNLAFLQKSHFPQKVISSRPCFFLGDTLSEGCFTLLALRLQMPKVISRPPMTSTRSASGTVAGSTL